MGRKPVLGLAGLVLASATLSGCFWDKNETRDNGSSKPPQSVQNSTTQRPAAPPGPGQSPAWSTASTGAGAGQTAGTTPPQNFRPAASQIQNPGNLDTSPGMRIPESGSFAPNPGGRTPIGQSDSYNTVPTGQRSGLTPATNYGVVQQSPAVNERPWNDASTRSTSPTGRGAVTGADTPLVMPDVKAPEPPAPRPAVGSQIGAGISQSQPVSPGNYSQQSSSFRLPEAQGPVVVRQTQCPEYRPTMPPSPVGVPAVPVLVPGANTAE